MGTKNDQFDESTKVRSAAEIDDLLRSASKSEPVPEAHDDFEHDAHTKVGNIEELVARTRARTADPLPRKANIVRRDSQPVPVVGRNTPALGARVATGSQSEIAKEGEKEGAKAKSDDAAFDEMLGDAPQRTPERTFGEQAQPMPLPAPPPSKELPVAKLPVAPRSHVRWGVVAWFALLAIMIGVGSVGYIRIQQLEDQLAAARSELRRK